VAGIDEECRVQNSASAAQLSRPYLIRALLIPIAFLFSAARQATPEHLAGASA
jgi:hypothetical protein